MRIASRTGSGTVGRLCSRTGCSERAAVTLTYDYGRSAVWLDHLGDERQGGEEPAAVEVTFGHG